MTLVVTFELADDRTVVEIEVEDFLKRKGESAR